MPVKNWNLVGIIFFGLVFGAFQFIFMMAAAYWGGNWSQDQYLAIGVTYTILHLIYLVLYIGVLGYNMFLLSQGRQLQRRYFLVLLFVFPLTNLFVCITFVWMSGVVHYGSTSIVASNREDAALHKSGVGLFGILSHVFFFCFSSYGWQQLHEFYLVVLSPPRAPVTANNTGSLVPTKNTRSPVSMKNTNSLVPTKNTRSPVSTKNTRSLVPEKGKMPQKLQNPRGKALKEDESTNLVESDSEPY